MSPAIISLGLYFDGTRELEVVRAALLDIACAALELDPRPTLVQRGREPLPHPQAGTDSHTFRTRYDDSGEIDLVEEVEHGSGNPRDGYGYHMSWKLRVGEELRVEAREADWGPRPKFLSARMIGPGLDVAALDRARARLQARFGAEVDCCDELWVAVGNASALLDGDDRDGARVVLERADWVGPKASTTWVEAANKLCRRLGIPSGRPWRTSSSRRPWA